MTHETVVKASNYVRSQMARARVLGSLDFEFKSTDNRNLYVVIKGSDEAMLIATNRSAELFSWQPVDGTGDLWSFVDQILDETREEVRAMGSSMPAAERTELMIKKMRGYFTNLDLNGGYEP